MDETAFLDKDYERKISFLKDQYTRMWTRFNIFVTLESSLIGGKLLFDPKTSITGFAVLGIVLSLIWYVFGANDKYLVTLYKKAVESASFKLMEALGPGKAYPNEKEYSFVGDTEARYVGLKASLLSWRIKWCSVTHLAALVPLLLSMAWVIYALSLILNQ
ncbi:MAG: hypothetical protein ABWZ25_10990 [Chitinophagaceae bacterium]